MIDREKVQKGLECCREMNGRACQKCPYISDCNNMSAGIPHLASDALELLKEQQETISSFQGTIRKLNAALEEQPEIVRCKDCKNWIAGYITDQDEFIPPKCGKYQQMVGHSNDDFCSLAERR